MSSIRTSHNKENPYVMLNKSALEDADISWGAKGLWAYLLSKPDNWQIQVSHLKKIYNKWGGGEKAIYGLLNELIENGYCERVQKKEKKSQFTNVEYVILEFKNISPQRQVRRAEDRRAEDGDLSKEGSIKNNENNTPKGDNARTTKSPRIEISFSFDSLSFEGIEEKDLANWKDLYPNVDISFQLKRMKEWIISNPSKAKSKKQWRKFINNWLSKSNDDVVNKQAYQASRGGDNTLSEKCQKLHGKENQNAEIHVSKESLTFILKGCQSQPRTINFKDSGAKEQINNELRKREFKFKIE